MPTPLNILVDARSLVDPRGGGVGRVAQHVLERLVKETQDVHFTCVTTGASRPRLPDPFADHARVTHVHLRVPNKIWSTMCFLGLTSIDRAVRRETGQSFALTVLLNIGFTGRLKTPYAIVLHDLSFLIEPRWFSWRMRIWHRAVRASSLIRGARHVFAVSHTSARDAQRLLRIPAVRIGVLSPELVIGRKLVPDRTNPQTNEDVPKPYVLAFAGSQRKNIATAVAAVDALRREPAFARLRLVIIGQVDLGRPMPATSFIVQRHDVSDAALHRLYAHASALLYPSWYEGFGLPPHEAAAFGIPVLASAHGAIPETAPPGTILIPPSKPQLWVAALRDVLSK